MIEHLLYLSTIHNTRIADKDLPNYNCINNDDKFTVIINIGNGKIDYLFSLISVDEVIFEGGKSFITASAYFYNNSANNSSTRKKWWIMSTQDWDGSYVSMFVVAGSSDYIHID